LFFIHKLFRYGRGWTVHPCVDESLYILDLGQGHYVNMMHKSHHFLFELKDIRLDTFGIYDDVPGVSV
jgi:hypothetical protein